MKETKKDKSIPNGGKSAGGKKRSTNVKTNPMGTAFDLSGSIVTETIAVKKPRKAKQTQGAKQSPQTDQKSKKNPPKTQKQEAHLL